MFSLKRRVDDEISVIRNDRSGFCYSHSQYCSWAAEYMVQVLEYLGVCKRNNLDGYARFELNKLETENNQGSMAHICPQVLDILAVVCHQNEAANRFRVFSRMRERRTSQQPPPAPFRVNDKLRHL